MKENILAEIDAAVRSLAQAQTTLQLASSEIERLSLVADYHDVGKGYRFESWFRGQASARGLSVLPRTDSKHDCIVNGKRVQCKRVDNETCSICTTPIIGRNYCGYEKTDWDVLAMQQHGRLLIIPVDALLLDDGVRVRNVVRFEDWSEWHDRWDVFGSGFSFLGFRQLMIFSGEQSEASNGR